MKKILLILLGGVLFMITVTGYLNAPNKKTKEEIEGLFDDFMLVFQRDDYDFLYDKEGNTTNLPEGDLGSWIMTTGMYYENKNQETRTSIQLIFNRNLKKCRGIFDIDGYQYPILYENGKIELIDKNISTEVEKNYLNCFSMLFV